MAYNAATTALSMMIRIVALISMLGLTACGTMRPGSNLEPRDINQLHQSLDGDIARFDRAYGAASANPTATSVAEYVAAGVTLSDSACEEWLQGLENTDRRIGIYKDLTNIVANIIQGVAGLNGVSSATMGRFAIGLGGVNASFDTYKADIIMGTIRKIRPKINEGRALLRTALTKDQDNRPTTVDDARFRLREYHEMCSSAEVFNLLETSLKEVAYVRPDTTLNEVVENSDIDARARDLYREVFPNLPGTFSRDDLYRVYAVLTESDAKTGAQSPLIQRYAADALVRETKKELDAQGKTVLKSKVVVLLYDIGRKLGFPTRLAAELKQDKAQSDLAEAEKAEKAARTDVAISEKSAAAKADSTEQAKIRAAVTSLEAIKAVPSADTTKRREAVKSLSARAADLSEQNVDLKQKFDAYANAKQALIDAREQRQQAADAVAAATGRTSPTLRPVLVPKSAAR